MKSWALSGVILILVAGLAFGGGAGEAKVDPNAPIHLEMWIGIGGELGQRIEAMAGDFNKLQNKYIVNVTLKGEYAEAMASAIAAYRSGNPPHILQVYEVGTGTMMANAEVIYPVDALMSDMGKPFNPEEYLSAITAYYSDSNGRMLSFPFNSSTPIWYYNADLFRKAGLDPDNPPQTWPEVAEAARKLLGAGVVQKAFTTHWPSWILIETMAAWHNKPLATLANGIGGFDTEFVFDKDELMLSHWKALAAWAREGIYEYGGRAGAAAPLFNSGEVAMYGGSSAAYAGIASAADFEFRATMLPYWPGVEGTPQNSIIGGGSLWVMRGHSDLEYRGVAEFFEYLSSAEVQAEWHQFSGYLPITYKAWELSREQGFYEKNPIHDLAIRQLTLNEPTDHSRGLRFGNFVQIRSAIEDEFEAMIAGNKSPEAALKDAVRRSNQLLREFQRTVK